MYFVNHPKLFPHPSVLKFPSSLRMAGFLRVYMYMFSYPYHLIIFIFSVFDLSYKFIHTSSILSIHRLLYPTLSISRSGHFAAICLIHLYTWLSYSRASVRAPSSLSALYCIYLSGPSFCIPSTKRRYSFGASDFTLVGSVSTANKRRRCFYSNFHPFALCTALYILVETFL